MDNEFVSEQLRELAAVDKKLEFILNILEKYDFPEETAARVRHEHNAITARMSDTRLKMAIVGEFSSGKSSFINALLREELLETDVLQGTTVLSTMLYYSDTREIIVFGKDGSSEKKVYNDSYEEFCERIRQLNRDTDKDSEIMRVEIGFPSELLKSGICIIDTPGTNSVNAWHDETTRRVIREEADGCIVLTSAVNPMPMSLCSFVRENLPDMLSECIFVATKYDLLKEKEKQKAIDYIALKAGQELELDAPPVLPYSSTDVLNCGAESELSRESERRIVETLAVGKARIRQRKILSLLRETMGALSNNMRGILDELEQRRITLEQAAVVDLNDFADRELADKTALYDEFFADIAKGFSDEIDAFCESSGHRLDDKLKSLESGDSIVKFFNNLSSELDGIKDNLLKETGSCGGTPPVFFGETERLCADLIEDFENDFQTQYPTLALLIEKETKPVKPNFTVSDNRNANLTANLSLTKTINADINKDKKAFVTRFGGGIVTGTTIGTALLPGLGTVTGLVIGGFIGAAAWMRKSIGTKRVEELHENTAADYAAVKSRYFEELKLDLTNRLNKYGRECRTRLADTMNEYRKFYKETVRALEKRDLAERRAAERQVDEIRDDIRRLTAYIEETESLSEYLTEGKERSL